MLQNLNALDICFLVILASSILLAFWKGFIQQFVSLAGWIVAFLAARLLAGEVAPIFERFFSDAALQLVAAYVVIILVVMLATKVVSAGLSGLAQKIGLGKLDRVLGILFGGLRGLVIIVLGVAIASLTELRHHDLWQESQLMPFMEQVRDMTAGQLETYISE